MSFSHLSSFTVKCLSRAHLLKSAVVGVSFTSNVKLRGSSTLASEFFARFHANNLFPLSSSEDLFPPIDHHFSPFTTYHSFAAAVVVVDQFSALVCSLHLLWHKKKRRNRKMVVVIQSC